MRAAYRHGAAQTIAAASEVGTFFPTVAAANGCWGAPVMTPASVL